jgi:hypothetical protein
MARAPSEIPASIKFFWVLSISAFRNFFFSHTVSSLFTQIFIQETSFDKRLASVTDLELCSVDFDLHYCGHLWLVGLWAILDCTNCLLTESRLTWAFLGLSKNSRLYISVRLRLWRESFISLD